MPQPGRMRVFFATAPWAFSELYPASLSRRAGLGRRFGLVPGATQPLGVMYLSSVLRQLGHQARFMDGVFHSEAEILGALRDFEPDVLGLASTSFLWSRTARLAERIRALHPDLPILAGGAHPKGAGAACLEAAPAIDYALVGDSEEALPELLEALAGGAGRAAAAAIPGVAARDGEAIAGGRPRALPEQIDHYPWPDYDLVELYRYCPSIGFYNDLPSMNVCTTRGCAYECIFCHSSASLRQRSVESVLDELDHLVRRRGMRHVSFVDECLARDRERILALCDGIRRRGLEFSWCGNARVDCVTPEILAAMRAAGCWRLLYGLESGVQRILDRLQKEITLDDSRRALEWTRAAGIESFGIFIFGNPTETFADGLSTIEFACTLPLDFANFLFFTPYPGTQAEREVPATGRTTGCYAPNFICFVPDTLSEAELAELKGRAYRRFYMRPGYLARRALAIRSHHDLARSLRGFLAFRALRGDEYLRPAPGRP